MTRRDEPSVPTSPREVWHDALWSTPNPDVGPLYRKFDDLPGSSSFPDGVAEQAQAESPGIKIDFESMLEASHAEKVDFDSQAIHRVPLERELPPLPTEAFQSSGSDAVLSSHNNKETEAAPRLFDNERRQLSDAQLRVRAEEIIREQVMRRLYAEQQTSIMSSSSRGNRPAVHRPLAPPPSCALPPLPTCSSRFIGSSRSSSGNPPRNGPSRRGSYSSSSVQNARVGHTDAYYTAPLSSEPSSSAALIDQTNRTRATSSSHGSRAASSIFDKELPTPPEESRWSSCDDADWTCGTISSGWSPCLPETWSETRLWPQGDAYHDASSSDEGEMQDWRLQAIEKQHFVYDRAKRLRDEQDWHEPGAKHERQAHESQVKSLAEREAELKAEVEATERHEQERQARQRARESYRQSRRLELAKALRDFSESDAGTAAAPILDGWLNLQLEGEVHWKRRWYKVAGRELTLSRTATDCSLKMVISLDPNRLISVSDQHEDGTMDRTLLLEVQQRPSDDLEAPVDAEKRIFTIHLDTQEAKMEIELVIEAIASL